MRTWAQRPFRTYPSAGLLAGALASLCFGAAGRIDVDVPHAWPWAVLLHYFAVPWCLMLPAVLVRPSLGRACRSLGAGITGSLTTGLACAVRIDYEGPPPPWPDFRNLGDSYLLALYLVGFAALALVPGEHGPWAARFFPPLVGCLLVALVGTASATCFPPRINVLETWEFCTIAIGLPLFGWALWGLFAAWATHPGSGSAGASTARGGEG